VLVLELTAKQIKIWILTHQDDFQIGPYALEQSPQRRKENIDLPLAFMDLVNELREQMSEGSVDPSKNVFTPHLVNDNVRYPTQCWIFD